MNILNRTGSNTLPILSHLRQLLNIGWMQCRITILTQVYVCMLDEFIVDSLLYKLEVIRNGNYTGIYTKVWIDIRHVRNLLDRQEKWELHSIEKLGYSDLRCVECHLTVCFVISVNWETHWLWSSQASHKLSDVIVAIRVSLPIDEKLN